MEVVLWVFSLSKMYTKPTSVVTVGNGVKKLVFE